MAADVDREFRIPGKKWTGSEEKLVKDILEEFYSKIPPLLLRMSNEGLVCKKKKKKKDKMSHEYLD